MAMLGPVGEPTHFLLSCHFCWFIHFQKWYHKMKVSWQIYSQMWVSKTESFVKTTQVGLLYSFSEFSTPKYYVGHVVLHVCM